MEEKFRVTAEEAGLSHKKYVIANDLTLTSAMAIRETEKAEARESGDPIAMDVKYRVERY